MLRQNGSDVHGGDANGQHGPGLSRCAVVVSSLSQPVMFSCCQWGSLLIFSNGFSSFNGRVLYEVGNESHNVIPGPNEGAHCFSETLEEDELRRQLLEFAFMCFCLYVLFFSLCDESCISFKETALSSSWCILDLHFKMILSIGDLSCWGTKKVIRTWRGRAADGSDAKCQSHVHLLQVFGLSGARRGS